MGKKSFDFNDFGFQLAPRLNAPARMIGDASISVEALLSDSNSAQSRVQQLSEINNERKTLQNEVYENALKLIGDQEGFIVIVGEELHEGIVGIVASKISEYTGYPSLVLSLGENGIAKGSSRSVGQVNIYDIIKKSSDLLIKFGGHAAAAGLAVHKDNLAELSKQLKENAMSLPKEMFIQEDLILGELSPKNVDMELFDMLETFAPYGEANPSPLFTCSEAIVVDSILMGKKKEHTTLMMRIDDTVVKMPVFNTDASSFSVNDKIKFNYSISVNEWKGNRTAQIMPSSIEKLQA